MNLRRAFRLLNPALVSVESIRIDGAGVALTPHDLAYCLAAMDELANLLCRVKYADQRQYETLLRDTLRLWVRDEADKRGWGRGRGAPPAPHHLHALADAVLQEFLHYVCPLCRGSGVQYNRARVARDCDACQGRPAVPSNAWRARAMGISRQLYAATWEQRYRDMVEWVQEVERKNLARAYARLVEL